MLLVLGPKRALRHLLGRRLDVYLLAVDDARQVLRPVHLVVVRRSGRLDALETRLGKLRAPEVVLETRHADELPTRGAGLDAEHERCDRVIHTRLNHEPPVEEDIFPRCHDGIRSRVLRPSAFRVGANRLRAVPRLHAARGAVVVEHVPHRHERRVVP